MYRILAKHKQTVVRHQAHPHVYKKPELLATRPNELWSWDITKLRGPIKWTYFYLYVLLDVFSRFVVGWMLGFKESAELAKTLITESYERQHIAPGTLTVHADNGKPMVALTVGELMVNLGVEKSHSRPHTSNDNPYSEALFKTVKYSPEFPDRFSSIDEARTFCRDFFTWYNHEHRHSGIAMLTPESVHSGQAHVILSNRSSVLAQAYEQHPERFVKGHPVVKPLPDAVWINRPVIVKNVV